MFTATQDRLVHEKLAERFDLLAEGERPVDFIEHEVIRTRYGRPLDRQVCVNAFVVNLKDAFSRTIASAFGGSLPSDAVVEDVRVETVPRGLDRVVVVNGVEKAIPPAGSTALIGTVYSESANARYSTIHRRRPDGSAYYDVFRV